MKVIDIQTTLGESPIWSEKEQALYFVDIIEQKLHRYDPKTEEDRQMHFDQPITAVAPREKGGLVAAFQDGFYFIDMDTETCAPIFDPEHEKKHNRFNDGKCDALGRFWAGTMHRTKMHKPTGSLYMLDKDLSVTLKEKDVVCSNGLAWSPDNRTFYFTESFRYCIFAYDFDLETATLSNRRLFAQFDKKTGSFPDGLAVDQEGCLWSAINGLGQIYRFAPSGEVLETYSLPAPRPTSCHFGGPDYKTLYITTLREGLSPSDLKRYPLSGSLFALPTPLPGLPPTPFQG